MNDRNSNRPNRAQEPRRRQSWLAIAALLTTTLLVGAATHGKRIFDPSPGSPDAVASRAGVSLRGALDRTAVLVGGDGLVRMELVITGETTQSVPTRVPTDLVVVLDRSGSMSGVKIRDARAAVRELIEQLAPEDRFALVPFSSTPHTAIELSHATPEAVARWRSVIDGISAGGGTNMQPALDRAFDTIENNRDRARAPRVILLSDGLASESLPVLRGEAVRAAVGEFTLSTIGVGSDFNQDVMATLADAGTGNYYYLQDAADLGAIFAAEFETARDTIATGLIVSIRPGGGVAVLDASGYPLEHSADGSVGFRPGVLFAGQERRIWVSFRVPADREQTTTLASVQLAYTGDGESHRLSLPALPSVATVAHERDFFSSLDVGRWERAVVVEEYQALQQEVAGYVRDGDREKARSAVGAFKKRNVALNRVAASPRVAEQLAEVEALEASVDDAFRGAGRKNKQNLLGKALHALSYEKRREGSRK